MVIINHEKCIGCGICLSYCPRGAIKLDPKTSKAYVLDNECTECGSCLRVVICPRDAIEPFIKNEAKAVSAYFSDPFTVHKATGRKGRGTEEMKTNDVTGRFRRGEVGFAIDIGRPVPGVTIGEICRFVDTLNEINVKFEDNNPIVQLVNDIKKGYLSEEIKNEIIHSVVLEFKVPLAGVKEVIDKLKYLASTTDTVFSVGVISRIEENLEIPVIRVLRDLGLTVKPWAKVNVGLGRPLFID
ncbi:MAG: 4Fe-4S dicluster domain-containing protein [Sulfolobales archaeon]